MLSAKDFCNLMQIVKVEPLAKINAIFSERMGADEYNIDGFDTREEGRRRRKRKEPFRAIEMRARRKVASLIIH